ncbi:class I SAM-dependent methyltransferase [Crossiella sp. SN42]|uniref:class I SAM-dependent methyltransferase n=1 Tax=Crossiella sp. SN42 TaxID=2944808 RepID=UPI00207CCD10|nr:class I SAM-dependent methyltransferase [Crossiella sp. SN42]MCO1576037.1 class I SAM-dependent methyltransferase [Crossiella sp. SN42]
MSTCRICRGPVYQFFDFGQQPISDAFRKPEDTSEEFFFHMAIGVCQQCTMVQLMSEVPREKMFHEEYAYHSSTSVRMQEHFAGTALRLLETECAGVADPLVVELGCNDGIMLRTVAERGVRHLGVDPSANVAKEAASKGVRVRVAFFEESVAREVRAVDGPAQVIYAANTICHIPYLDSVFRGVDALLSDTGVFVFEDPYLGDIVERASFDQIYDEHFYLFSATSVRAAARQFGFDLIDVERLPTHGGEVRYTIGRPEHRQPSARVDELIAEERQRGIDDLATLEQWGTEVKRNCGELVALLRKLKEEGATVYAYGATAKSATVTNYAGIGPDLVAGVFDSTPGKQHRLTPGGHLPVRPLSEFTPPYPDYLLLFAWNHAEEIIKREQAFREQGGKWILYVPQVHML